MEAPILSTVYLGHLINFLLIINYVQSTILGIVVEIK